MSQAVRRAAPSTIEELLRRSADRLGAADLASPRLEADAMLGRLLDCSRAHLLSRGHEPVGEALRRNLEHLVERRASGEPLQYVTRVAEFRSMEFQVDPRVLIPRPETEFVVEECLRRVRRPVPRIVDVGTGSGCIAISLAVEIPAARVTGIDRSAGALDAARGNAERLLPGNRIQWLQGDLVEPLAARPLADLIVSNPPYVAEGEMAALEISVRDHEPRAALVAGDTGLEVLDRLIRSAGPCLRAGGHLILEIGAGQWPAVRERLGAVPGWGAPEVLPDFQQIDRVVSVSWGGASA